MKQTFTIKCSNNIHSTTYYTKSPKYFLPLYSEDNICGKMYSVHDTFFDEIRHEGYETVMPCDDVAVFSTRPAWARDIRLHTCLATRSA